MSVPETLQGKAAAFFHEWRKDIARPIAYQPAYVDVISRLNPAAKDDIPAGVLLSQIVYWCLSDQEGKSKLRVNKEGQFWIAKSRDEWYSETRLTPERTDRALAVLEKVGLIERRNWMFAGKRTSHVRLITAAFLVAWYRVIHNIPPSAEELYVGNVTSANEGHGKSPLPVAVNPGDRSPSKALTGPGERPRPLTETTAETTAESSSSNYLPTPLPPTHGGTPLSRCAPSKKLPAHVWTSATSEEKTLWKARASAELLGCGVAAKDIRDSMVEQRARNLYESQSPGGLDDLKGKKK